MPEIYDKSKFIPYMIYKGYEIMLQKQSMPSMISNVVAFKNGTDNAIFQKAGDLHFSNLASMIKGDIDKYHDNP